MTDTQGIEIVFDHADSAKTTDGRYCFVIYLTVKSNGLKLVRVLPLLAVYATISGVRIQQRIWLKDTKMLQGDRVVALRSGTCSTLALVFERSELQHIRLGDKVSVPFDLPDSSQRIQFEFVCRRDQSPFLFSYTSAFTEAIESALNGRTMASDESKQASLENEGKDAALIYTAPQGIGSLVDVPSNPPIAVRPQITPTPDLGLATLFDSVEDSTMLDENKTQAFIIYFAIKNNRPKQIRVIPMKATYLTTNGEEIEQDMWLKGYMVGGKTFVIRSGTFRKVGLVFDQRLLTSIRVGDKCYASVDLPDDSARLHREFTCGAENPVMFSLTGQSVEHVEVELSGEVLGKNLNKSLERLELLEEKLGVSLEGLYVRGSGSPGGYSVTILGEARAHNLFSSEPVLIAIAATVYDRLNRVIDTQRSWVHLSETLRVAQFQVDFARLPETPDRIRIYPAR